MEFTNEDKQHMQLGGEFTYFEYGVHKVRLVTFTEETTAEGKTYIEVFFESEDGTREESKRQYLTTPKAKNYAFNLFKSLYVSHAPENAKETATKGFESIKNTTELVSKLNDKLGGKSAWISKYPSESRTMSNGKPAPEVALSAFEPKSRLVRDAEDVFGVKSEVADPTDAWGK